MADFMPKVFSDFYNFKKNIIKNLEVRSQKTQELIIDCRVAGNDNRKKRRNR